MAKILVVDDDRSVVDGLTKLLGYDGHSVTAATSGTEAIRVIQGEGFDVVLTDVEMPGASGLDVARVVRVHSAATCIYVASARDLAQAAEEAGACFFLLKPLDYDGFHEGLVACRSCETCQARSRCHGRLHLER